MTDTFWIIWFPTFIHKNFTPLTDKVLDKVTDIDANPLFLQVVLADINKEARSDVILRFSRTKELVDNNSVVAEIQLHYQDHSSNGLFLYKCYCAEENKFANEIIEKPRYATVFAVKKLFHRHTFHDFSDKNKKVHKDFYFKACVFPDKEKVTVTEGLAIDDVKRKLKGENNEFILHYLEEFEYKYNAEMQHFKTLKCGIKLTDKDTFKTRIEEIETKLINCEAAKQVLKEYNKTILPELLAEQAKYNKAVEIWKRRLGMLEYLRFPVVKRIITKILPQKIMKILPQKIKNWLYPKDKIYYLDIKKKFRQQIYKDSCLVVGETLFTNSLCHSKYLNTKVEDSDSEDVKSVKDKTRKLLLNIENLKYALNFVKDEHKDALNSHWNTKSIVLAITGITFSGIGILLTALTAKPVYQYLKEGITQLFCLIT
ncbi:MAG: hypothetical protein LBJ60_04915 [Tannerellaceae bacterium]|jgi:hypothetical protein|nr:hypothetical protein [Tannerellaceae bacterium]